MAYATYEYYLSEYYGNTLTREEFLKYAKRASAQIDYVTFGRLANMHDSVIPDAVRDAVCDVAEKLHSCESSAGSKIASESNDGYSVTYRDTGNVDVQKQEILSSIRTYLARTGLLYRGVACACVPACHKGGK